VRKGQKRATRTAALPSPVQLAGVLHGHVPEVRPHCGWLLDAQRCLAAEGIVICRSLIPEVTVRRAREHILDALSDFVEPGTLARTSRDCFETGVFPSLLSRVDLQNAPLVSAVLEHPTLFRVAEALLGANEAVTTSFKWLRAVPPGKFTGVHMDRVYVGAGQKLTAWVPLGNVPTSHGSLQWVPRSHENVVFQSVFSDYQSVGGDGTASGWLADGAEQFRPPDGVGDFAWHTTDFAAGDVAFFGMNLLHCTGPNRSGDFRISCDTRWQAASAPEGQVGPWRHCEVRTAE